MGRKVHPIGFRLGGIRDWQAKWFADKSYAEPLKEDLKLRQAIQAEYAKAATSQIRIDRQANMVSVTVHTARPGVVIGRGGQRVDKLRLHLESLIGKKIQLNIQEIQQPELDAYLVARAIGDQIESRISYRRAMKQAISRTIMAGAKGIRVNCAGRLGGAEIARRQTMHEGQVPLHTLRADIDYGFAEARTTLGRIGVKVWIYKGDVLPEIEELAEIEEAPPEVAVAEGAEAPVEAVAAEKTEVEAEVKPEEAPVEAVAAEKVEAEAELKPEEAPEAKPEKKPAKPAARKKAVAKAKEEKPAKPATKKKAVAKAKEAKPAKPAVEKAEVEAEVKPEEEAPKAKPEKKPAKPAARKKAVAKAKEAKPAKPAVSKKETATTKEKKKKDATTKEG